MHPFELKGCETMAKKQKLWLIAILFVIAFGGFFLLQRSIPDYVNMVQGEEGDLNLNVPFKYFVEEEVVPAGNQNKSNIPKGAVKISCKLLGVIPIKEIAVNTVERTAVIPGGFPVGVYMKTEGILVVGTGTVGGMDGLEYEPAVNIVQSGDYIIGVNGTSVDTKEALIAKVNESKGESVTLQVSRNKEVIKLQLVPVQTEKNQYRLGVWVRDDTQGIGTLTFIDRNGGFGALGHGISDVDTGSLLSIKSGTLYKTEILSITKGERGVPGELSGVIRYQPGEVLGEIRENTNEGIFGSINERLSSMMNKNKVEIAYKQEIKQGSATILCAIDGKVEEYSVEIEKIYLNSKEVNKSMVIRVTDEELLSKTGGIVQGMSGSPILQNGRLIGAVTHVFVQDSTSGFGIFIENMINVD